MTDASSTDERQQPENGGIKSTDSTERIQYLLEKSQERLANGCSDEQYNRALRDASAWWLTAIDAERAKMRKKIFKRERFFRKLYLKPPQIGWYNDYLLKKVERYEGWTEVFKTVDADEFDISPSGY